MALTLQSLRAYMQSQPQQSMVHMPALLAHFNTDRATIVPLLAHWERKGQLQACVPPGCGSRCVQCLPDVRKAYQWCGAAPGDHTAATHHA